MRYRFYPGARWFVFLFLSLFAVSGCGGNKAVTRIRPIMGTYVQITVIAQDKRKAEEAIGKAFSKIEEIDYLMSTYKPDSEISRLNQAGKVEASKPTLEIVKRALYFSELTKGVLDITYKPIMDVWDKTKKNSRLPNDDELREAGSLVDYRNIFIDGNIIELKKPGMSIDLSCIAKGYAVDKAIDVLRKNDIIKRALVNAGGDIYALGRREKNELWQIGIQDPRDANNVVAIMKLEDKAIATSGDYERYYIINGKKYPFIFNPESALPADRVMSATVIAKDCATSDALSTTCFILGAQKAMELIDSLEGTEAMIIGADGNIAYSQGMNNFLAENFSLQKSSVL